LKRDEKENNCFQADLYYLDTVLFVGSCQQSLQNFTKGLVYFNSIGLLKTFVINPEKIVHDIFLF
jgi:hypothetical protein